MDDPRVIELLGLCQPALANDETRAAPLLLGGRAGAEEVVSLVTRSSRRAEAERFDELGEHGQLLEQFVVEDPSRLVAGKFFVSVRRRLQRVPADDDRPWLL